VNKNTKIILIVIAVLIVGFLAFYLIDPAKTFVNMRNNQRQTELTQIADAITKFAGENSGTLPRGIKVSDSCKEDGNQICRTGVANCDKTDLSVLSKDGKYISSLPVDPNVNSGNYTGYNIVQSQQGRITLCAPNAEVGVETVVRK
jgi:hypothetical protein